MSRTPSRRKLSFRVLTLLLLALCALPAQLALARPTTAAAPSLGATFYQWLLTILGEGEGDGTRMGFELEPGG